MTGLPLNLGNFAANGCLVIERLFDPGLIDRIREEYERQYESFEAARGQPHLNVGKRRLHLPIELTGPLLDPMFLLHPLLRAIIGQLLPDQLVIDSVNVVTSFSGSTDQKVHRDHTIPFAESTASAAIPPAIVAVAIPLVDLDVETGGTSLFPGTMADVDDKSRDPADGIVPLVARGGCYVYDYRLLHAGLANRSQQPRPILFASFARHWFTDTINFKNHARLVMTREALADLPATDRPLFARLAAPGAFDVSYSELIGEDKAPSPADMRSEKAEHVGSPDSP